MSATDELLEKLRMLKYDYDSMSTSLEDAIDDIAYELEQAIAATLGTPISADLRTALDFMRIWITDDAHLGESAISYAFEKAEGLRKLDAIESAIADTLGRGTCEYCKDGKFDEQTWMMSNHGWQRINYCPNCGARAVDA